MSTITYMVINDCFGCIKTKQEHYLDVLIVVYPVILHLWLCLHNELILKVTSLKYVF